MQASRRILAIVLALLLIVTGIPLSKEAQAAAFSDTDGHWAIVPIDWASDLNLVGGYDDGTFRPDNPITRAEYISLLNRTTDSISKLDTSTTDLSFKDVDSSAWYFEEVQKAVKDGYLRDSAGDFDGNTKITRGEAAQYLADAKNLTGEPYSTPEYTDINEMNDLVYEAVAILSDLGIMSGYPDGSFGPQRNLTRAEVVSIFHRYSEATGDVPSPRPPTPKPPSPTPGPGPASDSRLMPDNVWSFTNVGRNFTDGGMLTKLNEAEISAIQAYFDENDASALITDAIETQWGGSCFGFTTTAALMYMDRLNYERLNDSPPNNLAGVQGESFHGPFRPQSLINTYQSLQATSVYSDRYDEGIRSGEHFIWYDPNEQESNYTMSEFIAEAKKRVDTFKAGGDPVVTGFNWYEQGRRVGHSVISYDYAETAEGLFRLFVYDPNYGTEAITSLYLDAANNAAFAQSIGTSADDIQEETIQLFRVRFVPTNMYNFFNAQSVGAPSMSQENEMAFFNYGMDDVSIIANGVTHNTVNPEATGLRVLYRDQGNPIYQLPVTQEITIVGEGDVKYALRGTESFAAVTADYGNVTFANNGGVTMDAPGASFRVKISTNVAPGDMTDRTIVFEGTDATNLVIAQDAQGYVINGENLTNVTIKTGSPGSQPKSMEVNTNRNQVILRPNTGGGVTALALNDVGELEPIAGTTNDPVISDPGPSPDPDPGVG